LEIIRVLQSPVACSLTCPGAKNDCFRQRIAAHAIGTMQPTGDFPGGKQAGYGRLTL